MKSNVDTSDVGLTYVVVVLNERLSNDAEEGLSLDGYSHVAGDVFCVSVDKASSSVEWIYPEADVFFFDFVIKEVIFVLEEFVF